MSKQRGGRAELGSATVLMAGILGVVITFSSAALVIAGYAVGYRRARAAADLSALSAAAAFQHGQAQRRPGGQLQQGGRCGRICGDRACLGGFRYAPPSATEDGSCSGSRRAGVLGVRLVGLELMWCDGDGGFARVQVNTHGSAAVGGADHEHLLAIPLLAQVLQARLEDLQEAHFSGSSRVRASASSSIACRSAAVVEDRPSTSTLDSSLVASGCAGLLVTVVLEVF